MERALLGGHSGVGKTMVARHLARYYGVGLAEVDDFRLVLQRMMPPTHYPDLHFFLTADIRQWSVDTLRKQLVKVNQIVASALEIVVANHVATNTPCILEGDGILPAFAAQETFAHVDAGRNVRAIFLIEHDKNQLWQNMKRRGRGFDSFCPAEQDLWVDLSWTYGQWLEVEAQHYSLPVVSVQPWDTLTARLQATIER